jgi:hypothetical protein
MKNYIIFTILLLLCFSFANDLISDNIFNQESKNNKTYYEMKKNIQFEKLWSNEKQDTIQMELQAERTKVADIEFKNNLKKEQNTYYFLDCGINTCNQIISYTPNQNMKLSLSDFNAYAIIGDAELRDVYFQYEENYSVEVNDKQTCKDIGMDKNGTLKQECTWSKKNITKTRTKTDKNTQYLEKGESIDIVFNFQRDDFKQDNDLIPVIHGIDIDEMAVWEGYNVSYTQKIDNPAMAFGRSNITSSLDNFPVRVQLNTTNSVMFNYTANSSNILFSTKNLLSANTSDLLDFIYVNGSNTSNTTYYVAMPEANMSSEIHIFVLNKSDGSQDDGVEFCDDINAIRWYDLEEASGTIYDACGNADSSDEAGLTYSQSGVIQDALDFDTGYVDVNNVVPLTFSPSKKYFFSFWNYLDSSASSDVISHCDDPNSACTGADYNWFAFYLMSSKMYFTVNGFRTPFTRIDMNTATTIPTSEWFQISTYWDTSDYSNSAMYFDATHEDTGGGGSLNTHVSFYPALGSRAYGDEEISGHSFHMDGKIDQPRVFEFSSALSNKDDFAKALDSLYYQDEGNWASTNTTATPTVLPSISPSPAYQNTTLEFSVNHTNIVSNVNEINYTIYTNGTPYLTDTKTGSWSNNQTVSLHNESGFIEGTVLTLEVLSTLANGTTLNLTNSSNLTISNFPAILTLLELTPNGSSYQLGPLQANITCEDADTFDTLTIYYRWNINASNQSIQSFTTTNDTLETVQAPDKPYSVDANYSIYAWCGDGTVNSSINSTITNTIQNYIQNQSTSYNSSQFDLLNYTHQLSFDLAGASSVSSTITLDGTTSTTTKTINGTNNTFSKTLYPPIITTNTIYPILWNTTITLSNSSTYSITTTYNITSVSSGFFNCNATITTPTINYSYYDADDLSSIDATLSVSGVLYRPDLKTKSQGIAFSTDTNATLCIYPSTLNISATIQESANATGYSPLYIEHPQQNYYNQSHNRQLYFENSTTTRVVVISVKNTNGIPYKGYKVLGYRYYPETNSHNLTFIGTIGDVGTTTQYVSPVPTLYNLRILNEEDELVKNITNPDISFCTNAGTNEVCYYNIILGNTAPFYYGDSKYYASKNCEYEPTTSILTCTADVSSSLNFTNATLLIRDADLNTYLTNFSTITANTITLTAWLNNTSTVGYWYSFSGNFDGTTDGYNFKASHLFDNGYISFEEESASWGTEGWFLTIILMGILSFASMQNTTFLVFGNLMALIIMSVLGFIFIPIEALVGLVILGVIVIYLTM